MYCNKNLQCNKELQNNNNYILLFCNYISEKWSKISVNFENLLRGNNRVSNNLKETFYYNASLA